MYNVVGIQKINYVSKKTNSPVTGTRLHCTQDFAPDSSSEGCAVDSFYCSSSVDLSGVSIGSDVEILFNRFGSVAAVQLV